MQGPITILTETAANLHACGKALEAKQKRQLAIDADWTLVELEPQDVEQLIRNLKTAASNILGVIGDMTGGAGNG